MSPIPNHCIECDKIATIMLDDVPYCVECGLKEEQKPDLDMDDYYYG